MSMKKELTKTTVMCVFATSWATTDAEIDELVKDIAAL